MAPMRMPFFRKPIAVKSVSVAVAGKIRKVEVGTIGKHTLLLGHRVNGELRQIPSELHAPLVTAVRRKIGGSSIHVLGPQEKLLTSLATRATQERKMREAKTTIHQELEELEKQYPKIGNSQALSEFYQKTKDLEKISRKDINNVYTNLLKEHLDNKPQQNNSNIIEAEKSTHKKQKQEQAEVEPNSNNEQKIQGQKGNSEKPMNDDDKALMRELAIRNMTRAPPYYPSFMGMAGGAGGNAGGGSHGAPSKPNVFEAKKVNIKAFAILIIIIILLMSIIFYGF